MVMILLDCRISPRPVAVIRLPLPCCIRIKQVLFSGSSEVALSLQVVPGLLPQTLRIALMLVLGVVVLWWLGWLLWQGLTLIMMIRILVTMLMLDKITVIDRLLLLGLWWDLWRLGLKLLLDDLRGLLMLDLGLLDLGLRR